MKKLFVKKHRASTLVTVLIIAAFVSVLFTGMYIMFNNNTKSVVNNTNSKQLFYYAKSGIRIAETSLNNINTNGENFIKNDFKNGVISSPLIDELTNSEIKNIPDNVKVYIYIDYINQDKINNKPSEAANYGVEEYYTDDKKNMFIIVSRSVIDSSTTSGDNGLDEYLLVEYLDANGANSTFE